MQGKIVKQQSPMEGALDFMGGLKKAAMGLARDDNFNDEAGNITVDTCCALDTGIWETGILRPDVEGRWVIVGQYEERNEAKEGHKGWLKQVTENPACELKDIDMWGIFGEN